MDMIKHVNQPAIVVSAIVFWVFGALWFWVFGGLWAAQLGSTQAVMSASNATWYPYAVSLVMSYFIAYGLDRILAWRGDMNPGRGTFIGLSMGLLIFGAATWLDYAFEHRGATLGFINIGYIAIGMAIQGAILGAWKPRGA
jgi:hypothetical protein